MDPDGYDYPVPVGCYGVPGSYTYEAMMEY